MDALLMQELKETYCHLEQVSDAKKVIDLIICWIQVENKVL